MWLIDLINIFRKCTDSCKMRGLTQFKVSNAHVALQQVIHLLCCLLLKLALLSGQSQLFKNTSFPNMETKQFHSLFMPAKYVTTPLNIYCMDLLCKYLIYQYVLWNSPALCLLILYLKSVIGVTSAAGPFALVLSRWNSVCLTLFSEMWSEICVWG